MLSWPLRRELDTAITKPPTTPPLPLPSTPTWRTPPWSLSPGCSPGGTRASWKGFPTKHGVMIHQRSCGAFECFVCEVSFTSAKELKSHMKSLHKYVCFMWKVSFTSTIELKSHKISVHNNVYWFHRVVLVAFIWTEYTGKYTPCSICALFLVKCLSLLQKFLCFVVKFLVHRLIYFTRFPCYNC